MPARPPGRVHLRAAAAAANDIASAVSSRCSDGEGVGAVKHVAGAGGIDGVDRIGRLPLNAMTRKPADAGGAARDGGYACSRSLRPRPVRRRPPNRQSPTTRVRKKSRGRSAAAASRIRRHRRHRHRERLECPCRARPRTGRPRLQASADRPAPRTRTFDFAQAAASRPRSGKWPRKFTIWRSPERIDKMPDTDDRPSGNSRN